MSQKRGRTAILVDFFKDALGHAKYRNLYILDSSIVILELPDSRIFKNRKDREPYEKILRDYAMRTGGRYKTGKDYDKVKQAIFCAIKKSSYLTICGPKERNKVKFCFKGAHGSEKFYLKIELTQRKNESMETEYQVIVDQGQHAALKVVTLHLELGFQARPEEQLSDNSECNDRENGNCLTSNGSFDEIDRIISIPRHPEEDLVIQNELTFASLPTVDNSERAAEEDFELNEMVENPRLNSYSRDPLPITGAHGSEKLYLKAELTERENESMETEDHGFEARPEEQLSVDSECKDTENGNCLTSNGSYDEIDRIISIPRHPEEDLVIREELTFASLPTVDNSERAAEEEGQQHDTSALLYFNEEMFGTFIDHSDLRYQDLRTEPDFCNSWACI